MIFLSKNASFVNQMLQIALEQESQIKKSLLRVEILHHRVKLKNHAFP
jgi:hypothetical protein